jgi:hypothetical protein
MQPSARSPDVSELQLVLFSVWTASWTARKMPTASLEILRSVSQRDDAPTLKETKTTLVRLQFLCFLLRSGQDKDCVACSGERFGHWVASESTSPRTSTFMSF